MHAVSEVHPVSYPMGNGVLPFGIKKLGSKADHPPPPSTKVVALGGILVTVLAIRHKVRGFKPSQGQWIFKGDENP
jgi:hypothetical protein